MKPRANPLSPSLAVLLLLGCTDLALEADRIPAELEILPNGGVLAEGGTIQFELVVRDRNGEEMTPPSWAPTVWTGTDSVVAEVTGDGMVSARTGGEVFIRAELAGLGDSVRVRINPRRVVLSAPVIYLNQAAQNLEGSVALIAGRPALIRVFMVGDQTSFYGPVAARVTHFQGETQVFREVFAAATERTPGEVMEGQLEGSVNGMIPGSSIQPGVTMVVELDPEGRVPLAPGSQLRYPAEGARPLEVVEPQLFRAIFVPTISTLSPDESVYEWTDGLNPDSPELRFGRTLMPVGSIEVEIADTYRTGADLSSEEGWDQWIRETRVLHLQGGRRGYHYGVAEIFNPAFGGLAMEGYPVSVGLPRFYIYAHELGHNMNLGHAPCGTLVGLDPRFPYGLGGIGIWGYDRHGDQLLDPAHYHDIMSYCAPTWISDYHFSRATSHRLNGDGGVILDGSGPKGDGGDRDKMLVVWGSVRDGRLGLDPAFVIDAPPALPETDGPYRVEGLDANGLTGFSLSFSPTPLEFGGGSFVYMVPWEAGLADGLDRMVLTGPEGEYTLTRSGSPPMAVVTDPSTGRIRAIIRDWDGGPLPGEGTANVTITRGIPVG